MKEQLNQQITFAKLRLAVADNNNNKLEVQMWSGYIQGLRHALTLLPKVTSVEIQQGGESNYPCIECKTVDCQAAECQCTPTDLQPMGECICGAKS